MLGWAADEGWNPGRCDAIPFHAADPTGFLIAEAEDGEPAAAISVVRYGDSFGFLGLYIVRPEYRGRGLGMAVWKAGMEYLAGRTVGLDGVVAQQDNYRKSGFELAHRNVRFQGPAPGVEQHGAGLVSPVRCSVRPAAGLRPAAVRSADGRRSCRPGSGCRE